MQQTDANGTRGEVKDPILAGPLAGFFATADSKTISIMEGQPLPDFVTLSFTDGDDDLDINAQTFYVPKVLFDCAIDAYRPAPKANHKPKA